MNGTLELIIIDFSGTISATAGEMQGYALNYYLRGLPGVGIPDGGVEGQLVGMGANDITEWLTPNKTMVGLGNVDNTSDVNKPVSNATQTALNLKADKATTYTKDEVIAILGDYYTKIQIDGMFGDIITEAELATALMNYYTKLTIDTMLALKADKTSVYTKSEIETMLLNYYTKTQIDSIISGLSSVYIDSTELANALLNYYTKSAVDTLLAAKANASDVYTKTEVTNLLANYYTSSQIDTIISGLDTTYVTHTELTNALTGFYTKLEVDNLLSNKVDKVAGKGLSTEDYTTAEKSKLAGIEAGATKSLSGVNITVAGDNTVNLNPNVEGIDYIDMDKTATVTPSEGRLWWNNTDGTLNVGLANGSVLQLGQEQVIRVRNDEVGTIPNGSAVYITGSTGDFPKVKLASATNYNESFVLGIATQDISAFGFVTIIGIVRDVNTNGIPEGTPIWLSTTSGQWTATRPTAPNVSVFIGYVIRSHSTEGVLAVKPTNVPRLIGLSDVYGTPTNDQVPYWNNTNNRFEFKTIQGGSGISAAEAIAYSIALG